MQMTKLSKADQTVEGICIILSNVSKATALLHQVVTADQFLQQDPVLLFCNDWSFLAYLDIA